MAIHQYSVKQTMFSQVFFNMIYYDHTPENNTIKQEITDALRAAWNNTVKASLSDEWSLISCLVRNVELQGTLSLEFVPTSGAIVGGAAADPLPTQVALLVVTKGPSTKPNRTRSYLAGFVETVTTDSQFTAGVLASAVNWGDAVADLATATQGNFLRQATEWIGSPPYVADHNPVDTVLAFPIPATQRRRRLGVGI